MYKYFVYRCPDLNCHEVHCVIVGTSAWIFAIYQVSVLDLTFLEIESSSQEYAISGFLFVERMFA